MGRKPKLTDHQKREAIRRRDHGDETLAEIGQSYNVSGWTIGSKLMPFNVNDDIYAVSVQDTGVVESVERTPINKIKYDELPGLGDHHDDDIRNIPFADKLCSDDFYFIISAWKENGIRYHKTRCNRNDGRRLFIKKSKSVRQNVNNV